jgi:hypothetical protein
VFDFVADKANGLVANDVGPGEYAMFILKMQLRMHEVDQGFEGVDKRKVVYLIS